ncbi:MAG: hypothetical protein J3K34DRAFT_459008 [Monoraphidium minutum]|nr:MAG: hypothetical protein J3K34DRAFT_459008 [Monoraphidium minutum]
MEPADAGETGAAASAGSARNAPAPTCTAPLGVDLQGEQQQQQQQQPWLWALGCSPADGGAAAPSGVPPLQAPSGPAAPGGGDCGAAASDCAGTCPTSTCSGGSDSDSSGAAAAPPPPPPPPGAGAGSGASAHGAALFCVERVKGGRHAYADASVDELWAIAQDLLTSPEALSAASAARGGGGAEHARRRRRRRRQTNGDRVRQLEAEVAAKLEHLSLLRQQRAWLQMREEVLADLTEGAAVPPAVHAAASGPSSSGPTEGPPPPAAGGSAPLPGAALPGAGSGGAAAAASGSSAHSGASLSGGEPSGGSAMGRRVVAEAQAMLVDVFQDRALQARVRGMTARQYCDAVKAYQMEYALLLQHSDCDDSHARLGALVAEHRRTVAAACLLANSAVQGAQFRHMETDVVEPPPSSHWARALQRIRPPLSEAQERRLVLNVLVFKNAMKALDDERRAILAAHSGAGPEGPEAPASSPAVPELQARLDGVLRRVDSVVLTHTVHAMLEMAPLQWASMVAACYPYTPSPMVRGGARARGRRPVVRLGGACCCRAQNPCSSQPRCPPRSPIISACHGRNPAAPPHQARGVVNPLPPPKACLRARAARDSPRHRPELQPGGAASCIASCMRNPAMAAAGLRYVAAGMDRYFEDESFRALLADDEDTDSGGQPAPPRAADRALGGVGGGSRAPHTPPAVPPEHAAAPPAAPGATATPGLQQAQQQGLYVQPQPQQQHLQLQAPPQEAALLGMLYHQQPQTQAQPQPQPQLQRPAPAAPQPQLAPQQPAAPHPELQPQLTQAAAPQAAAPRGTAGAAAPKGLADLPENVLGDIALRLVPPGAPNLLSPKSDAFLETLALALTCKRAFAATWTHAWPALCAPGRGPPAEGAEEEPAARGAGLRVTPDEVEGAGIATLKGWLRELGEPLTGNKATLKQRVVARFDARGAPRAAGLIPGWARALFKDMAKEHAGAARRRSKLPPGNPPPAARTLGPRAPRAAACDWWSGLEAALRPPPPAAPRGGGGGRGRGAGRGRGRGGGRGGKRRREEDEDEDEDEEFSFEGESGAGSSQASSQKDEEEEGGAGAAPRTAPRGRGRGRGGRGGRGGAEAAAAAADAAAAAEQQGLAEHQPLLAAQHAALNLFQHHWAAFVALQAAAQARGEAPPAADAVPGGPTRLSFASAQQQGEWRRAWLSTVLSPAGQAAAPVPLWLVASASGLPPAAVAGAAAAAAAAGQPPAGPAEGAAGQAFGGQQALGAAWRSSVRAGRQTAYALATSLAPSRHSRPQPRARAMATTAAAAGNGASNGGAGDTRVARLREAMAAADGGKGVQAYIIPSEDPHMSEYPPDRFKRREFISRCAAGGVNNWGCAKGLTGKGGGAGPAVDGRLLLPAGAGGGGLRDDRARAAAGPQGGSGGKAEQELGPGWTLMRAGTGHCPEAKGKELVPLLADGNLVDAAWGAAQPPLPATPMRVHAMEWAGESVASKLAQMRNKMKAAEAGALLATGLDEVAWLLNLRGSDVDYNPVFVSYAMVTADGAALYTDPRKVSAEVAAHLKEGGVEVRPYDALVSDVSALAAAGMPIAMDFARVSYAVYQAATEAAAPKAAGSPTASGGARGSRKRNAAGQAKGASPAPAAAPAAAAAAVVSLESPVVYAKAVKNAAELAGMAEAHLRDAVAICDFIAWLEEEVASGRTLTEVEVDLQLTGRRRQQAGFIEPSFPTIAGADSNGAVIHYRAKEETAKTVSSSTLLLLDSGGQFDCGTTDITRTMHLGAPDEYQRRCYTRVLQGHIGLDRVVFPEGTPGSAIDALARLPLWEEGLNYRHGTGHGVGAALNVHEGPQSISTRYWITTPLQARAGGAGMVCSNEPGYYEDGRFGIRVENLVVVEEADTEFRFGGISFLRFRRLTLVPIQTKMIEPGLMKPEEVAWLDDYHKEVWAAVSPRLADKPKVLEWLRTNTRPLAEQVAARPAAAAPAAMPA